jgi:hypothetical protein
MLSPIKLIGFGNWSRHIIIPLPYSREDAKNCHFQEFTILCYNQRMIEQALFLGCGLVVIGLILAIVGSIQLRIPLESLRWPSIDGQVEQASASSLRYRYNVHGKAYTGSRVSFRGESSEITARYLPGSTVKVYYDPARPDRSVLQPGAGFSSYLFIGLGSLLFVVGLIASLFAFVR